MEEIKGYLNKNDDIHRRLLKNIALNTELLYNDRDYDISEYDIQAFIALFLRKNLTHTAFRVDREMFGKFDCVIREREKKENPSRILFELKTYVKIKPLGKDPKKWIKESMDKDAIQDIKSDFFKLKKALAKSSKSKNPTRGFFILVCRRADLLNLSGINFLDLFFNKKEVKSVRKDGKEIIRKILTQKCDHLTVQGKIDSETVDLKISVWANTLIETENISVLSWEIK
ncbi:MAG: hypothetical protein H7246_13695 [Phycisphaerae bacterium]|nr:hypothetical protein [Saprospiraceae bacterium]